MDEILPGVLHWSRRHPSTGEQAHSYYVSDRRLLVDPMAPEEGVDSLAEHGTPERIVLTVRHHLRDSEQFVARYGCDIVAHEAGLHAFEGGPAVAGFAFGDEVAPGVTAHELAAITPEDTVLHIRAGTHALHFADGLRNHDGAVDFMPDAYMDDPEQVKAATLERLRPLLELDFDTLLFAHGGPIGPGGRDALARFADRSG